MNYLSLIRYKNYRNLEDQEIYLSKNINIFVGPNGSGKTNILESISLLSPGKGFKRQSLDKLQKFNCNSTWVIFNKYINNNLESDISITYEKKDEGSISEKILFNRKQEKKTDKLNTKPLILWFIPEMERLFSGQPSLRRNFIDRIAYSFDSSILSNLRLYKKLINERNEIFKRSNNPDWLDKVEEKIVELGIKIIDQRLKAIQIINKTFDLIKSNEIDIIRSEIKLIYNKKDLKEDIMNYDQYKYLLKSSRKEDFYRGGCKIGPHKSDIEVFYSKNKLEASYCSTAQQKEIILNILLSQSYALINKMNFPPVLLLDEVCSHLDENTRKLLLQLADWLQIQVLMTGTDKNFFSVLFEKANFFDVNNGIIKKIK